MPKIHLGPQTLLYPNPVLLVGANVCDKPNFMAVAWAGIANSEPPMISIALRHHRHTNTGIKQTKTFSVNIPSSDLVNEVDYCGLATGVETDKVKVCGFKIFYGKLQNAPMIEQCPVNLECSVVHALDLGSHSLLIGKIEETYVSDSCLNDGKPDVNKIKPMIYTAASPPYYQAFGEMIAKAFNVGKELKDKK